MPNTVAEVTRVVRPVDPISFPSAITSVKMHRDGMHALVRWVPSDISVPFGGACTLDMWLHFDDEHANEFNAENHVLGATALDTTDLGNLISLLQELLQAVESSEGRAFTAEMGKLYDQLQPYVEHEEVPWTAAR